ncbi:MAG: AmmeMemoRadiSam system radical SAM enzyme, partial [Gammaproteobacteria bacterium]
FWLTTYKRIHKHMITLEPQNGKEGKLWHRRDDNKIVCDLTPRHCVMKEGQKGFCGVRMNHGGKLMTVNYGRSVSMTEEVIETEAVYHYKPGAKILSLGNIGCMMNCDFCQNWETSQVRKLDIRNVTEYTPEQIVDTAIKRGIKIISWTYNDPVVWHEFVMDTAKLAKQHGLKNLYKSAFYITEQAAEELCEVIDIFSISLKSLDEQFYKKITKAELEPILKAIKTIAKHDIHLEISQLVVTDLNDTDEESRNTARWIVDNLGTDIPLHYVRFHPNYKYMHVKRTSPKVLYQAKEIAISEGIKHVYIGNLYEEGVSDTYCSSCNNTLITRFGMDINSKGMSKDGTCLKCGDKHPIVFDDTSQNNGINWRDNQKVISNLMENNQKRNIRFLWKKDINALHLECNEDCEEMLIVITHYPSGHQQKYFVGEQYGLMRVMGSKSAKKDTYIEIDYYAKQRDCLNELGLLDRAHFPVNNLEIGSSYEARRNTNKTEGIS